MSELRKVWSDALNETWQTVRGVRDVFPAWPLVRTSKAKVWERNAFELGRDHGCGKVDGIVYPDIH